MNRFRGIMAALLIVLAGPAAEAQDALLHPAKIGISAGTGLRLFTQLPYLVAEDAWAGIIFHITPAIALRPSLIFFTLDGEFIDNRVPTSSRTFEEVGVGAALGAFYYFPAKGNFLLYVGPEAKIFLSSELEFFDSGDKERDTSGRQLTVAAVIGTQFMLSERFGFQADAGFGVLRYTEHEKEWLLAGTLVTDEQTKVTSFFLRSAYLGAVFYFN